VSGEGQYSPLGRRGDNLRHVIVIEATGHEGGTEAWHIVDRVVLGRMIDGCNEYRVYQLVYSGKWRCVRGAARRLPHYLQDGRQPWRRAGGVLTGRK